jgi:serine/threonine protein kinase
VKLYANVDELSPSHYMTQNRYEVVSTIGIGATSRVDKAHDTLIDRTVALKTFGHGFGSEELQKQFVREAQILGRLSHPNIVSIYDLGTNENGSAYLVMEFVPGKTLESVMATQGVLPLSRVGVWAGDLANALNRAHRAGIIHGDVKPANIFVTEEGHIKLGDFGIARFATQVSGTGRLVGTPAYLSPEQIKGETQDHRSDIFSLGIILYQLAAGVRPFDGSSVTAVCAQIVATEPPPPSHYNPELPKEFDRIVMRCLAKNPDARYGSGESLAASLYPFARSKAEAAPNRLNFSWWKKPLRRRDAWISVAACSAAVLAIPFSYELKSHRTQNMVTVAASSNASLDRAANLEGSLPQAEFASDDAPATHDGFSGSDRPQVMVSSVKPWSTTHKKKPAQKRTVATSTTATRPSALAATAPDEISLARTASTAAQTPIKLPSAGPTTHIAAAAPVPLNIEITSAVDGETIAVYADQHLVATSSLSVTAAGETLHLERPLAAGHHEFRVALYRPDQSLHLERGGLAEIQQGAANLLSIKVVKHAKMLVKHDAALEILWPGALATKRPKPGDTIADASQSAGAK